EELADLMRLRQVLPGTDPGALGELLLDDLVAGINAFVTDVDAGTSDELLDLLLALSAERAFQQITAFSDACHTASCLRSIISAARPGGVSHTNPLARGCGAHW